MPSNKGIILTSSTQSYFMYTIKQANRYKIPTHKYQYCFNRKQETWKANRAFLTVVKKTVPDGYRQPAAGSKPVCVRTETATSLTMSSVLKIFTTIQGELYLHLALFYSEIQYKWYAVVFKAIKCINDLFFFVWHTPKTTMLTLFKVLCVLNVYGYYENSININFCSFRIYNYRETVLLGFAKTFLLLKG